jgi:hypothetical protein
MNVAPLRLALVIGAMKCGTTSLFQYLGRHPDVLPSRTKQLNFFSHDEKWSRGIEWYRSQWPAGDPHPRWLLEASPSYTYPEWAEACARRIAATDADTRLMYLVRDPIERIESHYFHGYHRGEFEDAPSIDVAIRRYPRLLDLTRYQRWIEMYRRRVGEERLLVLRTDDLDHAPELTLARVCRFLDIDDRFPFPDLTTRYNRQEMQPADHPVVERLRTLDWLTGAVRAAVPLRVRERVKLLLKSTPARDSGNRFRLSPAARASVLDQLGDDLPVVESGGGGS